jgi:hypothetical protein
MNTCFRLAVAVAIFLPGAGLPAAAQRGKAPVSVEFNRPPDDMKTGDEAVTTIKFRALADLDRLEVNIEPFRGVAVLSEPTHAAYAGTKKGDAPELAVRVRLTGAKFGSLSVTYVTESGGERSAGAMAIAYGRLPE